MDAQWPPQPGLATPPTLHRTRNRRLRFQGVRVDQAGQEGPPVLALAVVEQFVLEALAPPAPVDQHVLQLHQPLQVHPHLVAAPARARADVPPAEAEVFPAHPQSLAPFDDEGLQQEQEAPGLGRQLVQGAAQHLPGQPVGRGDVLQRHFQVLELRPAPGPLLHGPLVLVQQGDGLDQVQVLVVVPAGPGAVVQEGQPAGVRVDHRQPPQEPLGVAVQPQQAGALPLAGVALQGAQLPLQPVDGPGLLPVLVHRQHHAAVLQLLVDLDGGGGQEDHHRPLHLVLVRHQPPRGRVLAGGGDGQLPLALQQLQRVGGPLRPLLLGDGQDLVLQVRPAHVEQRLAGHGRVLHLLLFRHEGQDGLHQGRLAGRRGRLHQHRQGLVQLARDGRQVAHQLVRLLPHHPAGLEVGQDPLQQAGLPQQGQGLGPLVVRQLDDLLLRGQRPPDLLVLQLLQLPQHPPQVGLDGLLPQPQLKGRLLGEAGPLAGRVQVQRVHVEALRRRDRPGHQQVDPERLAAQVPGQPAHPPAPVPQPDRDLVAVDLDGHGLGRPDRRDGGGVLRGRRGSPGFFLFSRRFSGRGGGSRSG